MSSLLLLLPRPQAEERIIARIEAGRALLLAEHEIREEQQFDQAVDALERWHSYNLDLLRMLFSGTGALNDYGLSLPSVGRGQTAMPLFFRIEGFNLAVENCLTRLLSLVDRLELFAEANSVTTSAGDADIVTGDAVFIVHGHAEREYEVARVVEKLGVKTVILKDELNRGSPTLIEKLETAAARCCFAIVVVTPDDFGRSAKAAESDLRPRARQNVVLELGYFVAKFGRDRVVILHDESVEIPSDFGGVIYYPLDASGGWRSRIQDELRAALLENEG